MTVLVSCGLTSVVRAQAWLSDRSRMEGHGVKLGNFELHPGVGAEAGWQSNVFYADPGNVLSPSAMLRVSPHLVLTTRQQRADEAGTAEQIGGPRVTFRAGVSGQLYHYFAAYERTDFGVGADLNLKLNAGRPFSVIFEDTYRRDVRPFSQPGFSDPSQPVQPTSAPNYSRDRNTVGVKFQLATPGELLKGSLGYSFGFDIFEDAMFAANDNLTHRVDQSLSWTFLPKTALFQRTSFAYQTYGAASANAVSSLQDNKTVGSELGINGALTSTIGLTVAAGYGAGFYANDSDYESLTARVQGRWKISETVRASLGYQRGFQSTFQGNFARTDNIAADMGITMGGVFYLKPAVGVSFVDFGPTLQDVGGEPRNDIYLNADISGEYRVIDWLAFTAEVNYLGDFSDYAYEVQVTDPATGITQTLTDPVNFHNVEVWLGVRAFY